MDNIQCEFCNNYFSKMGISGHKWRCKKNPNYVHHAPFNRNMVTDTMRDKCREAAMTQTVRGDLTPYIGLPHSEETKAKIAAALIGNTNGGGRGIRTEGFGYTFKSTWEYAVAAYLTKLGLMWTYESFSFLLTLNSAYTPDFIIYNEYGVPYRIIEVKGYFWPASLEKFTLFKELYPQFQTELWSKDVLLGLCLI